MPTTFTLYCSSACLLLFSYVGPLHARHMILPICVLTHNMSYIILVQTKPLKPQNVELPMQQAAQAVGRAAQAVGAQAGSTTSNISKRVVADTYSLGNALWASINQFRRQLGLRSISGKETAVEAQKIADLGRKQQEARAWIERWRSRTRRSHSGGDGVVKNGANSTSALAGNSSRDPIPNGPESSSGTQAGYDDSIDEKISASSQKDSELDYFKKQEIEGIPISQRDAVEAVFAALERAQRAAEEATLSSSALQAALVRAESAGALSSSDEEDWEPFAGDVSQERIAGMGVGESAPDGTFSTSSSALKSRDNEKLRQPGNASISSNVETDEMTRQRILDEDVGVW